MAGSVEDRTRTIISEVFGVPAESVTLATSHEAIEAWDSLNILNILMAVEGEFGVAISPEEAANFVSVQKIVEVVKSKGVE